MLVDFDFQRVDVDVGRRRDEVEPHEEKTADLFELSISTRSFCFDWIPDADHDVL